MLNNHIGRTVGYVRVNSSYIDHHTGYDCASWWEDREVEKKVYSLTIEKQFSCPDQLNLKAVFKGKVVKDYFPGLWGGVKFDNKPYESKYIGAIRQIHNTFCMIEAIERTGATPGDKFDWYISPTVWKDIITYYKTHLIEAVARFNVSWNEHQDKEDEYFSKLNGVRFSSENINKFSKNIIVIERQLRNYNSFSEQDKKNFDNNTQWIKEYNAF